MRTLHTRAGVFEGGGGVSSMLRGGTRTPRRAPSDICLDDVAAVPNLQSNVPFG
jgi:hypothetical protein